MKTQQMKVTVRQLSGRPGVDNWHPMLEHLKTSGISKFLIDVKTDKLNDFFQHVTQKEKKNDSSSSTFKVLIFRQKLLVLSVPITILF